MAVALPILNAHMPITIAGRPISSLPSLARLNLRYLAGYSGEWLADHWYGISTRASLQGAESVTALTTLGGKIDAHPYEGTPFGTIKRVLAHLPHNVSNYSFVDYGSGKGRVILMASRLRFREVIGVEFAESLHQLAELNISRFKGNKNCPVRSVHCRAEKFEIPDGPCVLYLYNPFEPTIAYKVVKRIVSSYLARPRHMIIVLYHPMLFDAFAASGCFRCHTIITEGFVSSLAHSTRYVIRILDARNEPSASTTFNRSRPREIYGAP
jgi:hypothetical protein